MSQLRQHYWELRGLGVELVTAANDTPETNAALREQLDLPFTLLSDPEAEVARAYGAFHENEHRGRKIARVAMFLIGSAAQEQRILWEYVGPTSRHRPAPSRLSEEVQRALGRRELLVSVVVPSTWQLEQSIAALHQPPLGYARTPAPPPAHVVLLQRDYLRELAMQSEAEVQRLTEEGWTLAAVSPEYAGAQATGQRYVFRRRA
ncbi:MAG TPA: redoxin domain-containing protein [Nitrolancea sp.]|nr:redoxin domain-containing protein [Nitrolancea sp.]